MRKTICAVLATLGMVLAMLLGAAISSQAAPNPCDVSGIKDVPISCLNVNEADYKYVKKQVGANPYSMTKLMGRYSKKGALFQIASTVQLSTVTLTHHSTGAPAVPALVKNVPWPSYKAKSAKKYKKTKYSVYEIYGQQTNGFVITWKYGITRQADENKRPKSQYPACRRYFRSKHIHATCGHDIVIRVKGWFAARSEEAALTTLYAINHGGKCPPGMPKCV